MISYAQNFEDVILWRLFKNISEGHYIDLGAADPNKDSVTRWFYENGWSGINVEPSEQYYELLLKHRQRDINLNYFIGEPNATIEYYQYKDSGLSTGNVNLTKAYSNLGFELKIREVKSISSDDMLNSNPYNEIHFLKIDIEGFEKVALKYWNFAKIRPWVILVESTRPLTQETNYDDWEFILLENEYEFAYFDGLNRFYLSREHLNLQPNFKFPPNIFDGFKVSIDSNWVQTVNTVS